MRTAGMCVYLLHLSLLSLCRVCCAEITEDTTRMAVGYGNSSVQVFALNEDKLKPMRSMDELELLDQDSGFCFEYVRYIYAFYR